MNNFFRYIVLLGNNEFGPYVFHLNIKKYTEFLNTSKYLLIIFSVVAKSKIFCCDSLKFEIKSAELRFVIKYLNPYRLKIRRNEIVSS